MEISKSKVYVKTDEQNRITHCEGGFTTPTDLMDWIYIDKGYGDKYNLCQAHYFEGGLYTRDGVPRWKLENETPVLRTEEELETDRRKQKANPIEEPDYDAIFVDHEYRLTLLEWGV